MKKDIRVTPRNSVVLIMDPSVGVIPDSMGGKLVAFTKSCVVVGTLSEHDGQTWIMLSDEPPAIPADESVVFDGVLSTPGRELGVFTVLNEPLVTLDVSDLLTRVRIGANDIAEPDEIRVIVGN